MREFGWENLQRSHNLGKTGGCPAVLIWQAIPVAGSRGLGSIPSEVKRVEDGATVESVLKTLNHPGGPGSALLAVKACDVVEGSSHLGRLRPLVLGILKRCSHCLIIPVFEDRVAGVIKYGLPLPEGAATANDLRRALYDLGEELFRMRPDFQEHLGMASLRGLKKNWSRTVVVDGYQQGRELKGGQLLAASWKLAGWIAKHVPEKRLGIVLPPGLGATVANLACVLADVTPVNLNFTAGRLANEAALKKAGIVTVLTAEAMKGKVKDFPWPEKTIDLRELMVGFSKVSLAWRWLAGTLLPISWLRAWIGIPEKGGDREAALLFTSGSVGEPKGVVLTHTNLISNVRQIDAVLSTGPIRSLLACLPIFHSFGSTVTVWWPILGGPRAITYVSPTETTKLIELIEKYQVDLLLNTPTFLRNFLRKARPEQLQSLKIVVTGAEKLPLDLRAEFEGKFGVPVCEGFGMTEATPVVAVNLIAFDHLKGSSEYEFPRRLGSVGHLVPGIAVRIRDPESSAELPLEQSGMVWLKGANIFPGYLESPAQSAEVLVDGWYATADIGRVDEDGFLYIEGRISRFSKIAGEMVPHGVVENKLMEIGRSEHGEDFCAVVVGIPDVAKGESLVALVNRPIGAAEARGKLAGSGLPNLWLPRGYLLVDAIPTLATGKLDIKGCRALALQHFSPKG